MLRSLRKLQGYSIAATDGDIGSVDDLLLDDEHWTIRYLVAKTGGFFSQRKVLISPVSFREADWNKRCFHVALTRQIVANSPGIDADAPVSRQREREYYEHYGYAPYWGEAGLWGIGAYPGTLATGGMMPMMPPPVEPGAHLKHDTDADVHLRSAEEVRGYSIQGLDDSIGHVEDFIVDDETWRISYLVIDTKNWWFGKRVLVSPRWATGISWDERKLYLDLPRQAIKNSPAWDGEELIEREYEQRLHQHYGHAGYWEGEKERTAPGSST